jgi:hypothetical protein
MNEKSLYGNRASNMAIYRALENDANLFYSLNMKFTSI